MYRTTRAITALIAGLIAASRTWPRCNSHIIRMLRQAPLTGMAATARDFWTSPLESLVTLYNYNFIP